MTDLCRTARLSRLILAFCLVTMIAAARAQEIEPPRDPDTTADRASGSRARKKTEALPRTGEATPARANVSRWERFKDSVLPFRARRDTGLNPIRDKSAR